MTPGGKKVLVNPLFGAVSNDGRVHIKIERAEGAEVAVARGELEDRPPPVRSAQLESVFPPRNKGGMARYVAGAKNSAVDELAELSKLAGRGDAAQELGEMSAQGKQFAEFLQRPASELPKSGLADLVDAAGRGEK